MELLQLHYFRTFARLEHVTRSRASTRSGATGRVISPMRPAARRDSYHTSSAKVTSRVHSAAWSPPASGWRSSRRAPNVLVRGRR
jgi:hypothetical protein